MVEPNVVAPPLLRDMIKLIPEFDGNTKILSLFLRKCEYVIRQFQGVAARNEFIMQAITSKVVGRAAALISERGEFDSYDVFKDLLIQHFGDHRSEDCVAIELESLKIKPNESYLDFCSRIQDVRAILISKINTNDDNQPEVKRAKIIIHNNTSLNVFLYNLPEHMVRIIRLKKPSTLEAALQYVMEEVNFHEQYNIRSKMFNPKPFSQAVTSAPKFGIPIQTPAQFNFRPTFGPQAPPQNFTRPQFGYRPPFQQFGYKPPTQQFGYKPTIPQLGYRPPVQQFGYRPPQPQGFRPQSGHFGYHRPQPQGLRPQPAQFGHQQPKPQGYRPPVPFTNDVTMRTATALPKVPLNEIQVTDTNEYIPYDYCDQYEPLDYQIYEEPQDDGGYYYETTPEQASEPELKPNETENVETAENFYIATPTKCPR